MGSTLWPEIRTHSPTAPTNLPKKGFKAPTHMLVSLWLASPPHLQTERKTAPLKADLRLSPGPRRPKVGSPGTHRPNSTSPLFYATFGGRQQWQHVCFVFLGTRKEGGFPLGFPLFTAIYFFWGAKTGILKNDRPMCFLTCGS